jgi:hypothetical protein
LSVMVLLMNKKQWQNLHVVGGVLDGVGDLADDALAWLVNVWCRHVG